MVSDTLVLSAGLSVATASLYLYIGYVLRQRQVSPEARFARDLFAGWWLILGASGLLGVLQMALYMADALPVWLYLTFTSIALLAIFAALWALQCYLVYLYRGSRRAVVPLAIFYGLLYMFVIGLMQWVAETHPYTAITDNGWSLVAQPKFELSRGVGLIAVLVLVGPQMAAAFSYSRLFFKTHDRTQRYRIAMLSGAILGWFGTSLAAAAADASEGQTWQLLSRLIGLTAGAVILAAYRPPAWLRSRYGIRSLSEEAAVPEPSA